MLIAYSKLYDSIYEHAECPEDDVMNDDDLLDGWLIKRKKQKESLMKQQRVEEVIGKKHAKDDEIFIPVQSMQEAKNIDELNTPLASRIKQQREKTIEKRGTVLDANLEDVAVKRFNLRNKPNG